MKKTVLGPAKVKNADGAYEVDLKEGHGYCFRDSCRPANEAVTPVPLKAMGRFVHEAVAIDNQTGIVYLTEDLPTCRILPVYS